MPRRNHAKHGSRARNINKITRIGAVLDPLADREQRAQLIEAWIVQHGPSIRQRWSHKLRTGRNKTSGTELVICRQCGHHIAFEAPIATTQADEQAPVFAFHWRKNGVNCWSEFLYHQVRQAAEAALFTIQETA